MNEDFYGRIADAVKQLLSDEYEVLESNTVISTELIRSLVNKYLV